MLVCTPHYWQSEEKGVEWISVKQIAILPQSTISQRVFWIFESYLMQQSCSSLCTNILLCSSLGC